jgi:hypothetical protein
VSKKPKKELKSAKKKSVKKSENTERERKKCESPLFPPTHSGNPVSEPKAARHGGKQGS